MRKSFFSTHAVKMFTKLKRPVTILLMVLICFQIIQLLYRKRLWEITRRIEGQNVSTVNAKGMIGGKSAVSGAVETSGQEKIAQGSIYKFNRINKKGYNKQKEYASISTSTTTSTSKPTNSTSNRKNNVRISEEITRQGKAPVTNYTQAKVLQVIRQWRDRQAEWEKLQKLEPIRYDAHNFVDDVSNQSYTLFQKKMCNLFSVIFN